jgi:hypothetical protein
MSWRGEGRAIADNLSILGMAGIVCPACGGSTFTSWWDSGENGSSIIRLNCAACRQFVRHFSPPGGPEHGYRPAPPVSSEQLAAPVPAEEWHWLGMIRQDDNVWRPVGMARTLGRAWDVLLHFPGDGEHLVIPTRPLIPVNVLDAENAAADLAKQRRRR